MDNKSKIIRNARIPFFITEVIFLLHVIYIFNIFDISTLGDSGFFSVSTGFISLVVLLLSYYSLIKTKLRSPLYENFTLILFFTSFLIYTDIICVIIDGYENLRILNIIMQTLSYLLIILLLNLYSGFLYVWENPNDAPNSSLKNILNIITFFTIISILGNIPFGYYFVISEDGKCTINSGYYLFVILLLLIIVFTMAYAMKSNMTKNDRIMLTLVPIIPFLAATISSIFNGPRFHLMTFFSVFFLYTTFIVKKENELQNKELLLSERDRRITNSEINALRSKMNPHFIYNTLSTIYGLCKANPDGAADMTLKLENYLRDNFGKITIAPMIPFFEELEHLQFYIDIEQIRFPNLTVEFDTDIDYFMVPSLSVQPMVENAIRHGIQKKKDAKGTIKISTHENNEGFFIIIEDDGIGIDKDFNKDGKVHLGINNTRARIKLLCHGTLNIKPRTPEGTICQIFIPK